MNSGGVLEALLCAFIVGIAAGLALAVACAATRPLPTYPGLDIYKLPPAARR